LSELKALFLLIKVPPLSVIGRRVSQNPFSYARSGGIFIELVGMAWGWG
jgi:hypothetical protein